MHACGKNFLSYLGIVCLAFLAPNRSLFLHTHSLDHKQSRLHYNLVVISKKMFGHCKISHTSTSTYILYSSSFLFSSFLCFTLSFSSLSLFYLSLHLYFYPPTFLPPSLFYTPSYSEQRKVCQACYQVVKSYLRGDSRKNENYLARFIKFFQTQVDTHTYTHTNTEPETHRDRHTLMHHSHALIPGPYGT